MLMRMLRPLAIVRSRMVMPISSGIMVLFVSINAIAADRPDSFADQVERLSPAVVNISTLSLIHI